jgi:diacylglycerol kinase (ATP)
MKRKIRFIINPKSGVHQKNDIPGMIADNLDLSKFDYDIVHTEYRKHAKSLTNEAVNEGYDIVCAVGGDGSVHEVGTTLIGTKTCLAIIPAGSGNGLARHLSIPLELEKAIYAINEGVIIHMDTVLANDKPFLNVGGYGFDALIAEKFATHHKRGFWGYSQLISKEFFKYKARTFKIEVNGTAREERLLLCTVANASEFGNGCCISPNSSVTDGKLELCLMKPFHQSRSLSVLYKLFKRKNDSCRYSEIIPFEKARIELTENKSHYDGEPFDVRSVINIEIIPKSLSILVGKNSHA